MYKRLFTPPSKHYFLFGPRSTGKSTWLRAHYKTALTVNLLRTSELLRYSRSPDEFEAQVRGFKGDTVIIDEVQRMPSLLHEVHDLITDLGNKVQFVMTGSSARTLKRAGVDLLAGRALTRNFFSLVSSEFEFEPEDLDNVLKFGTLPDVRVASSEGTQGETLEAYADTYLREEVKEEALVRSLEPFSRFLRVAAIMNGQRLNLSNIARDAAVKRPTAEGYFNVLVDTLLGFELPAWQPRARIKEVALPKFYFFDPGVARVLSGRLWHPIESEERGFLLETFLLNEIRAYISYRSLRGQLYYWATPSNSELDLVFVGPSRASGFEFKAQDRWRAKDHQVMEELIASRKIASGWGVYLGKQVLRYGKMEILPVSVFLKRLWQDGILG